MQHMEIEMVASELVSCASQSVQQYLSSLPDSAEEKKNIGEFVVKDEVVSERLKEPNSKDKIADAIRHLSLAMGTLAGLHRSPSFRLAIFDYSEALVTCEKIIAEALEGAMQASHNLGPTSVRHQQSDEASFFEETEYGVSLPLCSPSDDPITSQHPSSFPGHTTNPSSTTFFCSSKRPDKESCSNSVKYSETTFSDVVGAEPAKRALRENLVLPLTLPVDLKSKVFCGVRTASAGVLLYGPPGNGKTTLALAAAGESGAHVVPISPSSVLSKFQGESERAVKLAFQFAVNHPPSCIFIDEIDSLGCSRECMDDIQGRCLLAELLLQMTELRSDARVSVIVATNRILDVDPALLRRFHARIYVGPANQNDRLVMIRRYLEQVGHCLTEGELELTVEKTADWSGSDIRSLCREAALAPVRDLNLNDGVQEGDGVPSFHTTLRDVSYADIYAAYKYLMET